MLYCIEKWSDCGLLRVKASRTVAGSLPARLSALSVRQVGKMSGGRDRKAKAPIFIIVTTGMEAKEKAEAVD